MKIIHDELREAVWIGEDGDMAVFCKTELGAFRKFRKLMKQDVGEQEAEEMDIENVRKGYFELATFEDRAIWGNEYDWFIRYHDPTPYEVWVYRN